MKEIVQLYLTKNYILVSPNDLDEIIERETGEYKYCLLDEHKYNKNYNIKHYFVQNKLIVGGVDLVVFFQDEKETTKLKDLKRETEKQNKSLVIKS